MLRFLFAIVILFGLNACAVDPVPELRYYPMTEGKPWAVSEKLWSQKPIVVETFTSNGVYGEQSILYATKPNGSLRAYHYQLWVDPPVRLLQSRLIKRLRDANVAPLVTDRLAASQDAVHVSARIVQFERVQYGKEWRARVELEMRVEPSRNAMPMVLKHYVAEVPAETDSMQSTIEAFVRGLDQIYLDFGNDFQAALQ